MMPTTGPTKISGYIYEVWKELECLLNFTTDFKNSVDSYWGSKQPDGSWNGLIGMLLRREIDAAVTGLSTTHERRKVIDFTYTTYVRSCAIDIDGSIASQNYQHIRHLLAND
uniref:Ionotropic glutamate receptor L-glutamate and glycine-binding domain-containing protein n=1 Tax=Timema cristinae TaxID=61476 RepID=A0A7R9DKW0_TIMCR|nr:unnamed protein product [Timema cristinae]